MRNKWSPECCVAYERYFSVSGKKIKVFLEEMSDQTIEITPYNVAFYYVEYCKQNKIKVNEFKQDNYIEKMQQPLNSDSVKEDTVNSRSLHMIMQSFTAKKVK